MNTYTNTTHPAKKVDRTAHNPLFSNIAILTILLTLVTVTAIAVYIDNQPVVAAETNVAVPYSNALEMQYARPWLEAQNRPVVTYGTALELQYAEAWLEAQRKLVIIYGNALEMQYAQPWLEAQNQPVVEYGNALELQYAQPWLDEAELPRVVAGNSQEQIPLSCSQSMEMLYACKFGFSLP
jgi:hypothetical protein